jgi:hypothetical protein
MTKVPDFIIVGAMKCATSSLHEQLAVQPGIYMSQLKEPNFFSDDDQYAKRWDWYCSHFESAQEHDLCGESSTHYTKLPTYPQTVQRLHHHLPNVKLVYVMRHPVDRLVSQYVHEWTQKVISIEINEAIDQHPELIDYSRYSMQLQPYLQIFGGERVLPVFFENLCQSPEAELERICNFLGYDEKPKWDEKIGTRNRSTERMRKSAWRDFLVETPILKEMRQQLIPKEFRTWVRSWWTMKQKPKLTAEKHQHLRTIFDQDLAVLGSWLGVELTCDNFKASVQRNRFSFLKSF